MRSLSFSKLKTSASYDNMAYAMDPSHIMSPAAHSRNSSAASAPVSPITSTASARSHSHSRFPSTASSLTTVPDSPTLTASKMTLHDLVEEPLEQEESVSSKHAPSAMEEPLCICMYHRAARREAARRMLCHANLKLDRRRVLL
jgi:hypothetical protein